MVTFYDTFYAAGGSAAHIVITELGCQLVFDSESLLYIGIEGILGQTVAHRGKNTLLGVGSHKAVCEADVDAAIAVHGRRVRPVELAQFFLVKVSVKKLVYHVLDGGHA
jgi:hypothetical protein